MSTLLKNSIIKELNAVQWSNEDSSVNSDKSFEAIITGISNYIQDNNTITGFYVGSHLTVPPTPIAGSTTHNLSVVDTTWLNIFKTYIRTGVASGGIQRMFTAIQTLLVGTVFVTLETADTFISLLPPQGTVVAPVIFPSVSLFGTPCALEISSTKVATRDEVWAILATYIQQSLNVNIIPPIPFSGTIVSPATAITTSTLVFS